jgi:chromate transporter
MSASLGTELIGGAAVGLLTPALLTIPLVHFVGRRLTNPRVKSALQTVAIASAGLLLAAVIPLTRDALTDPVTIAIAVATLVLMLVSEIDTLWIIL